jgi:hypothetical protein
VVGVFAEAGAGGTVSPVQDEMDEVGCGSAEAKC